MFFGTRYGVKSRRSYGCCCRVSVVVEASGLARHTQSDKSISQYTVAKTLRRNNTQIKRSKCIDVIKEIGSEDPNRTRNPPPQHLHPSSCQLLLPSMLWCRRISVAHLTSDADVKFISKKEISGSFLLHLVCKFFELFVINLHSKMPKSIVCFTGHCSLALTFHPCKVSKSSRQWYGST